MDVDNWFEGYTSLAVDGHRVLDSENLFEGYTSLAVDRHRLVLWIQRTGLKVTRCNCQVFEERKLH